MRNRNKAIALGTVLLTMSILIVSIPPAKAQFVIASWDFPDEYGQGIEMFAFYENSTGSWLPYGDAYEHDQTYTVEWNENASIKLRCYTFFNSTFMGVDTTDEGKNYQQHSVTVTEPVNQILFSQQNFTYHSVSDILDPMWYYGYEVVLNFLLEVGKLYTVTITYELFY